MAGRFEGLNHLEWKLFSDLFPPPQKRTRGRPGTAPRRVVNSLLYILLTGCRWCDLPKGPLRSSKSSAHRWPQRWYDGTTPVQDFGRLSEQRINGLGLWSHRRVFFPG